MKTLIKIMLCLAIVSACKKSNTSSSPTTLQIVANGFGNVGSSYVVYMMITNQNGATIFNKDTINLYSASGAYTYNVNVNTHDVLKVIVNSNISGPSAVLPKIDIKFTCNGQNLDEISGGIYNTQVYYNGNAATNTSTITIP